MPLHTKSPSTKEAAFDVSPDHLRIAKGMARKLRNQQSERHLDDEIESAAYLALVKAYRYYDASNLTDSLIARCVQNQVFDTLKRKANSGKLPIEAEAVDRTGADAWREVVSTDEMVDLKGQRELLVKLLDTPLLNNAQKAIVILMQDEEGYTHDQIGEKLGMPRTTVTHNYNKAIQALREAASKTRIAA